MTRSKEEGRALLEQVQEARRRVLADLAARRRSLGTQIEQLRAARDEMAASVHGVRDKVDVILDQLDRSEDEARAAALAVGDQIRVHGQDEAEGEPGDTVVADVTAAVGHVDGDAGDAPTDPGAAGTAPSVDELFADPRRVGHRHRRRCRHRAIRSGSKSSSGRGDDRDGRRERGSGRGPRGPRRAAR